MIGIVVARDAAACKVRVQFSERDNLISAWLPVGQKVSLGDREYWLPDLKTQVACLMDERCEAGVVLCAIYSDADPPPVTDGDLYHREFADGTKITYDRKNHKLTADVQGAILATATGKITAKGAQGVDIDGGPGDVSGAVQGQCICPLIKKPHLMVSATVKESL